MRTLLENDAIFSAKEKSGSQGFSRSEERKEEETSDILRQLLININDEDDDDEEEVKKKKGKRTQYSLPFFMFVLMLSLFGIVFHSHTKVSIRKYSIPPFSFFFFLFQFRKKHPRMIFYSKELFIGLKLTHLI